MAVHTMWMEVKFGLWRTKKDGKIKVVMTFLRKCQIIQN